MKQTHKSRRMSPQLRPKLVATCVFQVIFEQSLSLKFLSLSFTYHLYHENKTNIVSNTVKAMWLRVLWLQSDHHYHPAALCQIKFNQSISHSHALRVQIPSEWRKMVLSYSFIHLLIFTDCLPHTERFNNERMWLLTVGCINLIQLLMLSCCYVTKCEFESLHHWDHIDELLLHLSDIHTSVFFPSKCYYCMSCRTTQEAFSSSLMAHCMILQPNVNNNTDVAAVA